jgi:hypothetical protein
MKNIKKIYGIQEVFTSEGKSKPRIIGPTFETTESAEAWKQDRFSKGWKTDMKIITIHRITNV